MSNIPEHFLLHDFLNASPLLFAVLEGKKGFPLPLGFLSPSALGAVAAESSDSRSAFIGVVPSIVYPVMEGGRILPSFCIASEGKVETVCVYSSAPLSEVRKLFLDARSRTSQVMLKLLFLLEGRSLPEMEEWKPRHDYSSLPQDAGFLLIGDDNYLHKEELAAFEQHDLGAWWYRLTSEGFVHALTVCSSVVEKSLTEEINAALTECLHYAETHRDDLVLFSSERYGIPADTCRRYVSGIIRYTFDEKAERGLHRFLQLSGKHGVIPGG